jgi:hypothetical protein
MSTTPTAPHGVVHLRLDTRQLDAMRELARREDRSLSGQFRRAISEHLKGHDEENEA